MNDKRWEWKTISNKAFNFKEFLDKVVKGPHSWYVFNLQPEAACECGAEKVKSPTHSTWCPRRS